MNSVRDYNSEFLTTMLLAQLFEVVAFYSHETWPHHFNKRGGLGI